MPSSIILKDSYFSSFLSSNKQTNKQANKQTQSNSNNNKRLDSHLHSHTLGNTASGGVSRIPAPHPLPLSRKKTKRVNVGEGLDKNTVFLEFEYLARNRGEMNLWSTICCYLNYAFYMTPSCGWSSKVLR